MQILSASEFQKHAGVTSRDPNDHIYLQNGKTLNEVLKHLKAMPLVSWQVELEAITGMQKISNNYDASRDSIVKWIKYFFFPLIMCISWNSICHMSFHLNTQEYVMQQFVKGI